MRDGKLRLGAALLLLMVPYVLLGRWLLVHDTVFSAAGYLLAVTAGMLAVSWCGKTLRRAYLLHFPLFLITLLCIAYTAAVGSLPGYPAALVLLTTTWEEIRGFFMTWGNRGLCAIIVAATAAYVTTGVGLPHQAAPPMPTFRHRLAIILLFAATIATGAGDPDRFIEGIVASPAIGALAFAIGPISAADVAIHGVMRRKLPYHATRNAGREIHVLVIGESSRRASWSVYGYERETTPQLASRRPEIVLFQHAVADANLTVYAVPLLMTGLEPDAFKATSITGNILDLAREAGYSTSWLSNQDAGISYLIGIDADHSVFSTVLARPGYVSYAPDEVLLPRLEAEIGSGVAKFIGLHLYGSHAPYANRYPPAFGRFDRLSADNASMELDHYDDSILYTDWMLDQIIRRVSAVGIPATVTYLADHGEEVFALDGASGHGQGSYSRSTFEIPAFVWMNPAYRDAHHDRIRNLEANAPRLVRSHDFFYLLADLMGIDWPGGIASTVARFIQVCSRYAESIHRRRHVCPGYGTSGCYAVMIIDRPGCPATM